MEKLRGNCSSVLSLFSRLRAFVLQMGYVVSPKGLNERACTSLSNGHKLHGWDAQRFFLHFERSHRPGRRAIVIFIPGSWDTIEWDTVKWWMHTWVPECMSVSYWWWEQFSKALIRFRNLQYFLKKLGTDGSGAGLTTEGSKPHIFWYVNRREQHSVSISTPPQTPVFYTNIIKDERAYFAMRIRSANI